jgi:hypothetical protein
MSATVRTLSRRRSAHHALARLGILVVVLSMSTACAFVGKMRVPEGPGQPTQLQPINVQTYNERLEGERTKIKNELNKQAQVEFNHLRDASRRTILCARDYDWEPTDKQFEIDVKLVKDKGAAVRGFIAMFADDYGRLEQLFGRFQDYRKVSSELPHDEFLLRATFVQGLLVMYRAKTLLDLQDGLRDLGCSTTPIDPSMKKVRQIHRDLTDGYMPSLLQQLQAKTTDGYQKLLDRVQLKVLSRVDATQECDEAWQRLQTEKADQDATLFAWCGYYSFAANKDSGSAERYWNKSRQSIHDAASTSYASQQMQLLSEGAPAAVVRRVRLEK